MNIRRILFRVKVRGESLWPELVPGRSYWASNLTSPKPGDYVVFADPTGNDKTLIKKIQEGEDGNYIVRGTLPWSSSYCIAKQQILGKIIFQKV